MISEIDDQHLNPMKLRSGINVYKTIIQQADFGYALVEVLSNNKGEIVDFIFLEINTAFERLIESTEILHQRGSVVLASDKEARKHWMEMLENSAAGRNGYTEYCMNACQRWLSLKAYSLTQQQHYVIINDISQAQLQQQVVESFTTHSEEFLNIYQSDIDYQKITDGFRLLSKARFAILNLNNEDGSFRTMNVSGDQTIINQATQMMGINLKGHLWKPDPLRKRLIGERTITRFDSLSSLAESVIPRSLVVMLEKTLHVGQSLVVKIFYENTLFGDVTLVMDKDEYFNNDSLIELYAMQLGAMMQRRASDEMLAEKKFALEELNHSLEERIKRAVEENRHKDQIMALQARHAAMGEMIANIAHQWRQPLSTINLIVWDLVETFRNNELDQNNINEFYLHVNNIIQHMSQTIDDFRNFFHPQKDKTCFSLVNTIQNAISFLSANFITDSIKIEFEHEQDIKLLGYPNELVQVFINILNNARDKFLENEIWPRVIQIKVWNDNHNSYVIFKNNGGHIPEEIMGKIFDPYFTTREDLQGTGLGLYMSKTIVEKSMKGNISAANLDQGCVAFTIMLPNSE
jgi:signal transduction histidine kinase